MPTISPQVILLLLVRVVAVCCKLAFPACSALVSPHYPCPNCPCARAPESSVRGAKPKSVIIVFLTGGASHLDTFEMKPDAPPEVRGEYKPIATNVPGIQICEHLPRLAARADKYAIVRSLSHRENNHLVATHHLLTGHSQPGPFSTRSPHGPTGPAIRQLSIICDREPMASRMA